ncbi:MAG TPA: hypothetical protein VNL70_10510, partial [Tepidisphaeraceae bacterium]|nr:hypothetical protein [Tepidisphaeraceae bacterium]
MFVPAKSAFAFVPAVKNGLPALKQFNLSLSPSDPDSPGYLYGNQRQPFYAGDADGDGIADSLLFPLNVSIDGVEYFAAIRIVDNSAAVNINTAFSQHSDRRSLTTPVDAFNQADFANLSAPGAANLGMFRSHVGLLEMLSANSTASNADAEITALLQRRANSTTTYGSAIPVGDPDSGNVGVLRADPGDFQYRTLGDVWEHQLARRLENPGYNTTTIRYSPFTVSDLKSLAYRLTLPNAEGFRCLLETVFMNATPNDGYDSLSGLYSYPTAPYAPSQVDLWYSHRFNFDRAVGTIFIPQWPGAPYLSGTLSTAGNPLSLRAVLTTHNAVANLAPRHDMQLTGNRQILPENKTPMPVTDPSLLPLMPNHSDPGKIHTPAKTNINTAPFGELWRAFWEVMVDQSTHEGTPFGTSIATSPAAQRENQPLEVYFGNQFVLGTNAPTSPDPQHPQRMFRSSIRDMQPTPTVLFPAHQQLLLRAALAAVNAEDLRDSDLYTVTRRSIHLQMLRGTGATNAKVYVFGTERQPFITEVYACTDPDAVVPGGNPYVAIELYNPYDQPIDISDWTLAVLDRRLPGGAQSNPYPNQLRYFYIHAGAENTTGTPDHTTIPFKFRDATGSPVLVPAGGYLIIQSENGGPHPDHIPTPPGGTNVINVPNLHWVIERSLLKMEWEYRGGELVLLRPAGPVAAGQQRRLELGEWAPVDSFDFTGLMDRERFLEDPLTGQPQQPQSGDPPPEPVYFAWHYRRQNVDPGSTRPNWKFVYPGRYYG